MRAKRLLTHVLIGLGTAASACATSPGEAEHAATATAPPPRPTVASEALPQPRVTDGVGNPVSIPEIAERVLPSVVNISSTRKRQLRPPSLPFSDPFFRHFFGPGGPDRPRERTEQGLGSGVIVAEGVVLTNNHVVADAHEIVVTTMGGREYPAETAGTDPKSDLAVLRLKGDTSDLVPITWGSSSDLRLGDTVLAVGNPFGVGQTVTMGIVSALGRADLGIVDYEDFIQTDAAINPGNSGGALVNMRGELVGINTAILSRTGGSMGIGFAIPSDMAQPIMNALLTEGRVVRGWLGVSIQSVEPELAAALGLDSAEGVLVADIVDGTPAARAGLQRGDVITKVEDHRVTSTGDLRNTIAAAGAGRDVTLTIVRNGKTMTVKVELGEIPNEEGEAAAPKPGQPSKDVEVSGIRLEPLTPALRKRLRVPAEFTTGAVISEVAPGSPAAEAQLMRGDVLLRINGKAVTGTADASRLWKTEKGNKLLLVLRDGRTLFVLVKPETD